MKIKIKMKSISIILIVGAILFQSSVQAKRFGSGNNRGRQNTSAINKANNPNSVNNQNSSANSTAPSSTNQQQTAPQSSSYNKAAQPQQSRFGGLTGLLGGMVAGLGLAWLASKLGLGGAFSSLLTMVLIAGVLFAIIRFFKNRAKPSYATANAADLNNSNYNNNVNNFKPNDFSSSSSNYTPYAPQHTQGNNVAASMNNLNNAYPETISHLISTAPFWFNNIQKLSDKQDVGELSKLLSDELLSVIKEDFKANEKNISSETITQNLQFNMLDWRETNYEWLATIQYTAKVSEDGKAFEEINEAWTFVQDKTNNQGWKLDGISQLNTNN